MTAKAKKRPAKTAKRATVKRANGSTAKLAKSAPALLDVERARAILEECRDVEQILEIRDAAKLAAEYQRIRGASVGSVNDALELALRAQRKFGGFLLEHGPKRGNPQLSKTPTIGLDELGVTPEESSRCKKLAKAPEEVFEDYVNSVRAKGEKLTTSGALAAVSDAKEYNSDEWGTPPEYVALVREVLGEIDLDPASNEHAQSVVLAQRYFVKGDDGLAQEWAGRVFLNPPYSQPLVAQFTGKLVAEFEADRVEAAICLVNNSTDTEWGQALLVRCTAVCFPNGRLAFLDPEGKPQKGGKWGQAFFYFGPDSNAFEVTFGDVGAVLRPTSVL